MQAPRLLGTLTCRDQALLVVFDAPGPRVNLTKEAANGLLVLAACVHAVHVRCWGRTHVPWDP